MEAKGQGLAVLVAYSRTPFGLQPHTVYIMIQFGDTE